MKRFVRTLASWSPRLTHSRYPLRIISERRLLSTRYRLSTSRPNSPLQIMGSKESKTDTSNPDAKSIQTPIEEHTKPIAEEHNFKRAPDHLRCWICGQCGYSNPLFDSQCKYCKTEHPLDEKAKTQLISLCQMYNDPSTSWNSLPVSAFNVERLTKAISNKIYKISVNDENVNKLHDVSHRYGVLRIFNHRMGLSLDQLLSVYKAFADSGLGTAILGEFDIGQIEQFIEGRDLNPTELLENDQISSRMAIILSRIHRLEPSSFDRDQSEMITKLRGKIKTAIDIFGKMMENDSEKTEYRKWQFLIQRNVDDGNDDEMKLDGKVFGDIIYRELESLLESLKSGDPFASDLVFCHNDYHSGNMILENKQNTKNEEMKEDKKGNDGLSVKVIDYEYSGYNFRAFDFGNFFNELMIDNYFKDPPFFKIDEAEYPSKEYRMRFVKEYMKGMEKVVEEVEADELELLVENRVMAIEYGCLLSHFWWAIWGIVESEGNDIEWDYLEYARQRLYNYFLKKKKIENEMSKM